jgi:hypothetical protein
MAECSLKIISREPLKIISRELRVRQKNISRKLSVR